MSYCHINEQYDTKPIKTTGGRQGEEYRNGSIGAHPHFFFSKGISFSMAFQSNRLFESESVIREMNLLVLSVNGQSVPRGTALGGSQKFKTSHKMSSNAGQRQLVFAGNRSTPLIPAPLDCMRGDE